MVTFCFVLRFKGLVGIKCTREKHDEDDIKCVRKRHDDIKKFMTMI